MDDTRSEVHLGSAQPADARAALTLKWLGGFTTFEIARAGLVR